MLNLVGKRILLIAPRFFGYERDILEEIDRQGGQVDWLPDRPFDSPSMAALTKFVPASILPFADRLYFQLLESFNAKQYDFILVINGQTLSSRVLRFLKSTYPAAKLILYMWDSIENRSHVTKNFSFFDSLLSFDPKSNKEFGMRLRPLFFSQEPQSAQAVQPSYKYDLSFVGTAHSDRYSVINRLRNNLPEDVTAYWYLYLQSEWIYHVYKALRSDMASASRSDFNFNPLSRTNLQAIFIASRSSIDIEHPLQRGLTMRTFETLGMQRKLITTNGLIAGYDFFHPDNVCVIDRHNPVIPRSFFDSPFHDISPELRYTYSISGWLDDLITS
jgi:hypothetical protein